MALLFSSHLTGCASLLSLSVARVKLASDSSFLDVLVLHDRAVMLCPVQCAWQDAALRTRATLVAGHSGTEDQTGGDLGHSASQSATDR